MREWGAWIILLKGLTPIPYKIVTIASGFAGYNLLLFILLSFVARGVRFFLLAFLLAPLRPAGARHHRGAARLLGHDRRRRAGRRHHRGGLPVLNRAHAFLISAICPAELPVGFAWRAESAQRDAGSGHDQPSGQFRVLQR